MFYQLLCVQQSCSSTQSWGNVLPSIVETRDQNSQGCPLLFSNRNLGSFSAQGIEILYTHSLWEVVDHSRSKMHFTCLIINHDPGMPMGPESNRGPLYVMDLHVRNKSYRKSLKKHKHKSNSLPCRFHQDNYIYK